MARRKVPETKGEDNGHRMGKHCGYTETSDGMIVPAPMYREQLDRISHQISGINDMLKMVSSTAADMLTEVNRQKKELWDRITDDYGLNRDTHDIFWNGYAIKAKPKSEGDAGSA